MTDIAVLGFGVVGSGVVEVAEKNRESIYNSVGETIRVKKILDIRDFSHSPYHHLFTRNSDEIFQDNSIQVVVETIGGTGAAYDLTKKALSCGKNVVTSNKELVAAHGPELLELAAENDVIYHFEASVGGGIPIIRPLRSTLAANEIQGIIGILNGTTNYILTSMKRDGKSFEDALREAQRNGYAEQDPAADIEGHDACRKIAILSSIAYHRYVDYREIQTEGISNVHLRDIEYAEASGGTIKLIAESRRADGKIYARVAPAVIYKTHPLANVEDVFNAIIVQDNVVGDTMFYGKGAGKFPTAGAVISDVIDIMKASGKEKRYIWDSKSKVSDYGQCPARFYVRLENVSSITRAMIEKVFGKVMVLSAPNPVQESEMAFITGEDTEENILNGVHSLKETGCRVTGTIRVLK